MLNNMHKIALFGGTGTTGLCALEAALKEGYSVSMLVRDIARVPDIYKNNTNVKLVVGDVTNLQDVKKAVEGQDGVVVTLGTRGNLSPTTDLSNGLRNIIDSMVSSSVKTISVCLSAFLFYEPEKVPPQFNNLHGEHKRMYDMLKNYDNLNWIAVCPPHISDSPRSEVIIKHGEHPGQRVISKYDLGAFFVESLSQKEHYKQTIGIANVQK